MIMLKLVWIKKDQEELKEFQMHDIGTSCLIQRDLELCSFYQSDRRNNDKLLDDTSVGAGELEAHVNNTNVSQNSSILQCTLQREDADDKHTQDQEAGEAHTALAVQDEGDASSSKEKVVVSSLNDTSTLRYKNISNQSSASSSRTYFDWNRVIRKAEKSGYHEFPGVCGLTNLGNTRFMNSMLQCLSNAGVLTTHFISREFEHDINEENVLGTQGEMALKFYQLIKQMWKVQIHSFHQQI